jgi:alpha-maltose-1-phosphate synthase
MRVAHILRKYRPSEWGGTETSVQRLLEGLAGRGVQSIVYHPATSPEPGPDPLRDAGHVLEPYRAFVPVFGLSREQRSQLVAIGGNLMSLDLIWKLWRAPGLSLIHTHALNRIGGIALTTAKRRRIPLVLTIHGGVLDLPASVKATLQKPLQGGLEWGKIFGALLRSRRLLQDADAIITCNPREAELLREKFPAQRILVQPHGVPVQAYARDERAAAREAFPQLAGRDLLLVVGRIDPVKNQAWLVEQMPALLQRHPNALLVLVGACTDEAYGKTVKKEIRNLGLDARVVLAGGLPPGDRRLIGLIQQSRAVLVPSLSETFGLVIIEAWAAGVPVLASATSGACSLVQPGQNGWLFHLEEADGFHRAVDELFGDPEQAARLAAAGRERARQEYDTALLSGRVFELYQELIHQHEIRHTARR